MPTHPINKTIPLVDDLNTFNGLSTIDANESIFIFPAIAAAKIVVFLPILLDDGTFFELAFAMTDKGRLTPQGFSMNRKEGYSKLLVEKVVTQNEKSLCVVLRRNIRGTYRLKILSKKKDFFEIQPQEINRQITQLPHHRLIQMTETFMKFIKTYLPILNSQPWVLKAESLKILMERFSEENPTNDGFILNFQSYDHYKDLSDQPKNASNFRIDRVFDNPFVQMYLFTVRLRLGAVALTVIVVVAYLIVPRSSVLDKGLAYEAKGAFLEAAQEYQREERAFHERGQHSTWLSIKASEMYRKLGDENSEFLALTEAFRYQSEKTIAEWDRYLPLETRDLEFASLSCDL